ncbi:MAG: hypothetical protein WCI94_19740 [Rhodospirillales bacterium]
MTKAPNRLAGPMVRPDVYVDDSLLWSEHRAHLLHRLASGEAPNEIPDWTNIVEPWPQSDEVPHGLGEARRFHGDAADRLGIDAEREGVRLWLATCCNVESRSNDVPSIRNRQGGVPWLDGVNWRKSRCMTWLARLRRMSGCSSPPGCTAPAGDTARFRAKGAKADNAAKDREARSH